MHDRIAYVPCTSRHKTVDVTHYRGNIVDRDSVLLAMRLLLTCISYFLFSICVDGRTDREADRHHTTS